MEYTNSVVDQSIEYGTIRIELYVPAARVVARSAPFAEFLSEAHKVRRCTYPDTPLIVSNNPWDPDEVFITPVGGDSYKYRVSEYLQLLLDDIVPVGSELLESYADWRREFLRWWNRCLRTD